MAPASRWRRQLVRAEEYSPPPDGRARLVDANPTAMRYSNGEQSYAEGL